MADEVKPGEEQGADLGAQGSGELAGLGGDPQVSAAPVAESQPAASLSTTTDPVAEDKAPVKEVVERVRKLRKDVVAKAGDMIPLVVTVVDDHDSGNVVLEIGGEHFRLSQAKVAECRADAEYPHPDA